MSISDRIRVKDVRILPDAHGTLKNTTLEWRRTNGEWQTQHREIYDRGGVATILAYRPAYDRAGQAVPLSRLRRGL